MLNWTDADLESLLEPNGVIAAIRDAFAQQYVRARMPRRLQLDTGAAIILIMPCALAGEPICGTKIVSVSHEPRPEGRVTASYFVIDTQSGQTVAVLAANYLTDVRTAATSAIATALLARPDAATLGIFGTGRQAQAHIRVLCGCSQFQQILVCGSSPQKAQAFAKRMQIQYGMMVTPADAATCAARSDVICTCTNSAEPLFSGGVVRPGTHLNLIGTFQPSAREVDSALMARSRIFVDTYEGVLSEAGDILVPLNAGEIQRDDIKGDLHELLIGKTPGRVSQQDITVFKSVGCALEDLVTARLALSISQKRAADCG